MCHIPLFWLETFVTGILDVFGTIWDNLEQIKKSALYKESAPKFPTQHNFGNENPTNGAGDFLQDACTDGLTKKT